MKRYMYMMRHGETLFNQLGKIQGWCDSPLTEKGIEQAKTVGRYFKDHNIHFDHGYCSILARTSDTLEYVTDGQLEYTRIRDLREMGFGRFEGEHEYLNPPHEQYENFFVQYGGESRAQVKKRVMAACLKLMNESDYQNVLVVSHGGACSHFLSQVVSPERYAEERKKGFSNCCVFKYSFEDGQFALEDVIRLDF